MTIRIRSARPGDAPAVAEIYLAAIRSELPYLRPAHTDAQVRAWYADVVLPTSTVLLAVEEEVIVGYAAGGNGWLDHLYLRPDRLRAGIGSRLLTEFQDRSPDGLQLYVFQRNWPARAFYRRHGFVPVTFGSGVSNEELEPDVRLRWVSPPSG